MIQTLIAVGVRPTDVANIEGWETEPALVSNSTPFPVGYRHSFPLSDLGDAMNARRAAVSYMAVGQRNETKWREDVWNKALGKDGNAWETR
jgi:hypothetical protein